MPYRNTLWRAAPWAVAALIAAGAGWAGQDWKEVPNPDELMFEEEFPLEAGARLRVDLSDVNVDLVQTDAAVARVAIYASGRDRDEAKEVFDKLHFKVTADDNTVLVQTRRASFQVSGLWEWSSSRVRVRAIVTIPKGTDMRVKTSDGNVRAHALAGPLEARTSDGSILIDGVDGPSVSLRTSDGDIRVGAIRADFVEARSSDGDVSAKTVVGKDVSFSTSDGDVTIESAEAESIQLKTSDGDITVTAAAGKVRAHTSDGDIRVTLAGDTALDLSTSDGDIVIDLPSSIGAELNLRGEDVRLTGGIDIQGEVSKSRVRGSLGKGGVEIVARTSDGTVVLERH